MRLRLRHTASEDASLLNFNETTMAKIFFFNIPAYGHVKPSLPVVTELVQGLEIVRPDQVWVSDITYVHLRYECVYLAVIMDVFTRAIRGWQLSRSLDQQLTLVALQRALVQRKPELHHSDQGLQYAA